MSRQPRRRQASVLERRRETAAELLLKGLTQAQVARQLKVSRESVSRWATALEEKGIAALRSTPTGRKRWMSDEQQREVLAWLERSPRSFGYSDDAWTTERLRELIETRFRIRYKADDRLIALFKEAGFRSQIVKIWMRIKA